MDHSKLAAAAEGGSRTGSCWTDEKHLHFLNSMEASFVRTMFKNHGHVLRLDRLLPDTSDSTLDLKPQNRKTHAASEEITGPTGSKLDGRAERRSRRSRSSLPYSSARDQVVPQVENREDSI